MVRPSPYPRTRSGSSLATGTTLRLRYGMSRTMCPEGQQVALIETSDIGPHAEIGWTDIRIQEVSTGCCICVIHAEVAVGFAVFSAKGTQTIAITPTREVGILQYVDRG
ncbi:hypothetical protein V8C26DRAFT_392214 [Trichoderma gracile]